jgi:predicted RNA-binding protein with PUA-like domain
VGLARAASDAYPDPKAGDPRIVCVDLAPDRALAKPVTLAAVKADPRFEEFALVRQGRLSVMPVPDDLWAALLAMAR